jgi:hypothetical protein
MLVVGVALAVAPAYGGEDRLSEERACQREARKRYGVTAAVPDKKPTVSVPRCKPLRPDWPKEWPKDCSGTVAVHEILFSPTGKPEHIWTIRTPCKWMDDTVRTAIRHRQCEAATVDGKPVPFCLTVSTHVEVR